MYGMLRLAPLSLILCASLAHAEVSFVSNPIWLSDSHVTEGVSVTVSTVITKRDLESVEGTVTFYAGGNAIGSADFSLPQNVGGTVVAVSFVPEKGAHTVSAKITRAVAGDSKELAVSEEVKAEETLTVEIDTDRDGVSDAEDADDDNDGASDVDEKAKGTDPLKKEASATPSVAGLSTTSPSALIEEAKDIAGPLGETVFETTENWREKGKEYFDANVAKTSNVNGFASSTNAALVSNPKEGVMGIWEMVSAYFFKAGAFIFGNVYAFYLFFILLILWMLRRAWRRYSLD